MKNSDASIEIRLVARAIVLTLAAMLAVTAVVGPAAAQEAKAATKALREGDAGPAVEGLQRALNARLSPSPGLGIDGDFGPGTRAALVRFQAAKGLAATGVADAKTWEALGPIPKGDAEVPPPEVVNAEKVVKRPEEPPDGPPLVSSKAWAIADGQTGAILWGKDEAKAVEMASTTKIMTAYVVLRTVAKDPAAFDEAVTFSKRADDTPGSTSGVREGERLPVRELLYGLLLPSGNDASVALAEHFGGRLAGEGADPLARFVAAMNREAAGLGLLETHYANPHGLPAAGHHSSARDLALLATRAMNDPRFAAVVGTARRGCTLVDREGKGRNVVWANTNHLLEIEGYDGVKTGTTSAAGSCLVASARRGGDHLIVVALGGVNASARDVDVRNLARWAWTRRGRVGP